MVGFDGLGCGLGFGFGLGAGAGTGFFPGREIGSWGTAIKGIKATRRNITNRFIFIWFSKKIFCSAKVTKKLASQANNNDKNLHHPGSRDVIHHVHRQSTRFSLISLISRQPKWALFCFVNWWTGFYWIFSYAALLQLNQVNLRFKIYTTDRMERSVQIRLIRGSLQRKSVSAELQKNQVNQ